MKKGEKHSEKTKRNLSKKQKELLKNPTYKKKILKTSFRKGHTPWNKGLKGIHMSPDTEFKKGDRVGEKHPHWKGGVQVVAKDCIHIRVDVNTRARRPHLVWERIYKMKVPKGFVVYHLDGNKYNDAPSNLALISRAELLRINRENYLKNRRRKK